MSKRRTALGEAVRLAQDDFIFLTGAIVCCMPWHARGSEGEPVNGGECRYCHREIAVPVSAKGKPLACIYCGMERGFIPRKEIEPD